MPTHTLRTSTLFFSTLVLSLAVAACGNNNSVICNAPGSSATCTCGGLGVAACPVNPGPEFIYASGGGQIAGFGIDHNSGALTQVATATGPSMSFGLTAVSNQFLYASDPFHSQLDGFSIDQITGALTTLASSPFSTGPLSLPEGLASPPGDLASAPGSSLLYVADAGKIDVFTVDTTGTLTALSGSPFLYSGGGLYLTVDPSGSLLYVSIDNPPGSIFGFTVGSSGAIAAVPGSPFAIPGQTVSNSHPNGIVDTGAYVYAALSDSDQIAAFSITRATGVLTPVAGSPFPAGASPIALAVAGNFLYALNDGTITGYSIDSSSGVLTPISNSPFAISGAAIATDFFGEYLYVVDSAEIQVFSIDGSSGNLTPMGSPLPANLGVPLALTLVQIPPP